MLDEILAVVFHPDPAKVLLDRDLHFNEPVETDGTPVPNKEKVRLEGVNVAKVADMVDKGYIRCI